MSMQISISKKVATILGFISGFSGLLALFIVGFNFIFHTRAALQLVILLPGVALILGVMSLDKNNSNNFSKFFGALGVLVGIVFLFLGLYMLSFAGF